MTAADVIARLAELRVTVEVADGKPYLRPPPNRDVTRQLRFLLPHLEANRADVLAAFRVWDAGEAAKAVQRADDAVYALGVPVGRTETVATAVAMALAAVGHRDLEGVLAFCRLAVWAATEAAKGLGRAGGG